tara:strand:- start:3498 stop:3707 length:210 start_codon:yes stop_codon:yes gene_type:complete
MKFGNKKMNRYALGVRSGLHAFGKFGAKASHIAGYASPVALAMGQPEIAATLEAASTIGGGVSKILKNV